jgi:2-keto-4-pentenoate hydratase/2-oxohepta-3-ene-1,7-dioic acid hydratase in catechol pathway
MTPTRFGIGTFAQSDGTSFPGLVLDGRVTHLGRHLERTTSVRSLLESWDRDLPLVQALADRLTPDDCEHQLADLRPLPPVDPPGQLFQAGANYKQHLVELMSASTERMHHLTSEDERREAMAQLDERGRTGTPYVFIGTAYSFTGADDDIVLPESVRQPDWELELAVVIGRRARNVRREQAFDVVAGYTICNDVSARDRIFRPDLLGIGTDWLAGKNWPTFSPIGPYIVPAEHVGDPMDLQITLRLNGNVMQDSSTADMMFDIPRLIEYATSITDLRPGDVLLTGSPAGNGVHHGRFLEPGDLIESEITGLGRQRNRCTADSGAVAAPAATQAQA